MQWSRKYQDDDLRRVAESISVSLDAVIMERPAFEAAAGWFGCDERAPKRPAVSLLVRKLQQVERTLAKLVKHLEYPNVAEALANETRGGEDEIWRAVHFLEKSVHAAVNNLGGTSADEIFDKDVAINIWISKVVPIYERLTGNVRGTSVGGAGSRSEGIAGGPLIRFLQAAAVPIGFNVDEDAWRARYRRIEGDKNH